MPAKKKFVVVGPYIRAMPKKGNEEPAGYPKDERKCTMSNCANHYYNAQGQLNCRAYFDFIPKPWRCEEDGNFSPHVG